MHIQKIIKQAQKRPNGMDSTIMPKFWKPDSVVETRRREWETSLLGSIGVPVKYRRFRLSDFQIATDPAECFRNGCLDWSHHGFLLRGTFGQGKSCFAGAAIRAMLHPDSPTGVVFRTPENLWSFREGSIRWWHASDLTNWILDMTFSGNRREMFSILMEPRVIVLDDLGRERINNEAVREAIGTALERWTSNGKFLIVTTNIATDEALAQYEGFIASRLNDLVEVILPPMDRRGAYKNKI